MMKATFAAGCFWGVEEAFRILPGVENTSVGYTGGTTENPTYKEVCTGNTGHAEAIQIEFNSHVISYEQLLNTFWEIHNPSTKDRQGADVGRQYRSAIFTHNEEQKSLAHSTMKKQSSRYSQPIVTEITPMACFYPAEEYHQQYIEKGNRT